MIKKFLYVLLFPICLMTSSCTMMVKGLVKLVVKDYNDYVNTDISNVTLLNKEGKPQLFREAFAGKTVYLYAWENEKDRRFETDSTYLNLQQRFAKYPDVVFASLYVGNGTVSHAYQLSDKANNKEVIELLYPQQSAPMIIGKNGAILSHKGPKPTDKILVDYVLFEARSGVNGTKAAKRLIRGVNGDREFKSPQLYNWYENHFNKVPNGPLSFSVSNSR